MTCPTKEGKIDLASLMGILGNMGITSLLVEGGASVIGSLIRERLVDKFYIFKAPRIFGGDDGVPMAKGRGPKRMDQSLGLRDLRTRRYGDDILFIGYPDYK
jgi:diaminohydroxyphosphoribosylaminopyrimidine deaminase/5-amino-6-(5-phosphoribosylamino)uracil reductase